MSKFIMLFVLYVLFSQMVCGWFWSRRRTSETKSTTKPVTTTSKATSIHDTYETPILTSETTAINDSGTSSTFPVLTTASSCADDCKREDNSCDTPKRKCAYVNDTTNIPSQCVVVLKKSCVSEEALSELDQTPVIDNKTLHEVFSAIDDKNCNCRNRSMELICHALLPLCSVESGDCETITCDKPELEPSCQDYCLNLTNSCLSDETGLIDTTFKSAFNMTITEACKMLPTTLCWEPNVDNGCIVSNTTDSFTISPQQTIQPGFNEDLNASVNIVAIIVPMIGGIILLLLIAILVYRFYKPNAKQSNHTPAANEIEEKELVYNVLYKSVDPQKENGSAQINLMYEDPDKSFKKNETENVYENTTSQSGNEEKLEVNYAQVIKPMKKKLEENEESIYSLAQD